LPDAAGARYNRSTFVERLYEGAISVGDALLRRQAMSKKALCVGINYEGSGNDLKGCIHDANAWAELLVDHFDFPKPDVKLLLETQATKTNIIAGLKALLAGAKRGDVLVFQNSSHGTYVVDQGSDELDRYDEAICPYDFKRNLILDDEMREIFSGLPARVQLTVILDSCHSGTGTREVFSPTRKPRFLDPTEFGGAALKNPEKAKIAAKLPQARMKEILLSGCKSTEYSYDAQIGGAFNGAMTYYAIDIIKKANYKIAYLDLATKLNSVLKAEGFNQQPQLEGKYYKKKRPVFA
jgi:metacaspase-1